MKNRQIKGFTLIEILLVIAIIGILAGAVFAMIGNGDGARRKTVLSTAKSIMPYAQECLFKGEDLVNPTTSPHLGGGPICSDSVTNWPEIGVDDCDYAGISGGAYSIVCTSDAMGEPDTICCDSTSGACTEEKSCP